MTDTRKTSTIRDKPQVGPVDNNSAAEVSEGNDREKEVGGRAGPDPTRYGDWEKAGRCIDF